MKKLTLLMLIMVAGTLFYGCTQPAVNSSTPNTNAAQQPASAPAAGEPSAAAADDKSAIGDVVMSVLDIDAFRKMRGDRGPKFRWMPADGSPMQGDIPGMTNLPDFQGRYPRGYSKTAVSDLAAGETGNVGTTVGQSIQKHKHDTVWGKSGLDSNDGNPYGPVFQGGNAGTGTEISGETGGIETRPNSVVMYFYIKVRM